MENTFHDILRSQLGSEAGPVREEETVNCYRFLKFDLLASPIPPGFKRVSCLS